MAQKVGRRAPPPPPVDPLTQLLQRPPSTLPEHLVHIKGLGQLVTGYVQAMGKVDKLSGVSAEAKARAVVAFYEQLAIMETRLRAIHESLQLE